MLGLFLEGHQGHLLVGFGRMLASSWGGLGWLVLDVRPVGIARAPRWAGRAVGVTNLELETSSRMAA